MLGRQRGFTLVELAIVLVIIGLILGMAFKGRDLIDGAKVKNLQAQYNKVVAGINVFYEKYGFYPGDGCTTGTPAKVSDCSGTKDGVISGDNERQAFWTLLIDRAGILQASDRKSVFGQDWIVWNSTTPNWLWMDFAGAANADIRYVCQLDKLMDDGDSTTGIVRDGDPGNTGPAYVTATQTYKSTDDCWALSGQANVLMRVMP